MCIAMVFFRGFHVINFEIKLNLSNQAVFLHDQKAKVKFKYLENKKWYLKRNGDDIPILPLTNMVDIYRYSDEMLKHMPEKALKTIENDLLYS